MPTAIRNYFQSFGQLFRLPREFWTVQALNFVFCAFYFTFVTISTLHLSQDMGFSDESAGLLFGVFMFGTAIVQMFFGPVLDKLGYRKTPLIAASIITFGTLAIGLIPLKVGATELGRNLMVGAYLVSMIGNGLMFPVLTAGVKRFSNSETVGAGFNMWYLTMNIGAIMTIFIDVMRRPLEDGQDLTKLAIYRDAGGNALLMWYLTALVVLCWIIVYLLLRREEQFPEFDDVEGQAARKKGIKSTAPKQSFGELLGEVWKDSAFRKLLAFLLLTIPAHIPFVAIFVIYPKYYTRVIAADVDLGSVMALNPFIIVIGLILFAPLLKRFNVYWVLTTGMFISGASCLILAIPPQWVMSTFNISTVGQAYMSMVILQILMFACGEFIWSPQLQAYIGSVAPKGKEGTFLGIGRYPYTTAKLLGGAVGGFLLANYCPDGIKPLIESGEVIYRQSPEFMNLLLALFTMASPLALILLKKYFYIDKEAAAGNE